MFEEVTHLCYVAGRERFVKGFQENIYKIAIWVDKPNEWTCLWYEKVPIFCGVGKTWNLRFVEGMSTSITLPFVFQS